MIDPAQHDVVCLGEALVDFLPARRGLRVRDVKRWTPCLGGAPANVAVGVARLGGTSALVGVTGDDEFGYFLKQGLAAERVNVRHLRQTPKGKTGLGFVSLTVKGERSFTFYRLQAAEQLLVARDVNAAKLLLRRASVLHVGTNSLLRPAARQAVHQAIRDAFHRGQLISSDPNLRLHLWKSPNVLKALLHRIVKRCSILKLSSEEISFVTGCSRPRDALKWLERRGVILPIVTLGEAGSCFRFHGKTIEVKAPKVKVVDTTGAGDGFCAGFLFSLTRKVRTVDQLTNAQLDLITECAQFGCIVGAHVVTQLGAVAGLPTQRAL